MGMGARNHQHGVTVRKRARAVKALGPRRIRRPAARLVITDEAHVTTEVLAEPAGRGVAFVGCEQGVAPDRHFGRVGSHRALEGHRKPGQAGRREL